MKRFPARPGESGNKSTSSGSTPIENTSRRSRLMTARSPRLCAGLARLGCAVLALGLLGCGADKDKGRVAKKDVARPHTDKAKARAEAPADPAKAEPPRSEKPIPRKIIYTGQVSLT